MDRWQLWRRVWFRMKNRRNPNRRHYAVATRTRSDPESGRRSAAPARYLLGPQHFSFFSIGVAAGITQRPKVLLNVDCSNLLIGGSRQYENFSSTCWLEDHLHRFGEPAQIPEEPNTVSSSYEFHGITEFEASSCCAGLDDRFEDFSADSSEESDEQTPSTSHREQRSQANSNDSVINLHRYPYVDLERCLEPPPYEDEPPPSYEEAIAGGSGFLDLDNSDFLW